MEKIKKATRESFGETLRDLARENDNIVVLDADLSASTKTSLFKNEFPDRFINCGISECNMMSVAAGLAGCGFVPFAASFAMFAINRAYEQIRNSISYPNLNVKIIGSHAGITVGADGASHQCCEDIALMRTLPDMLIVNPCDDIEMRETVKAVFKYNGPAYIRLGRVAVPSVNDEKNYKFDLFKGDKLKDGNDITIIATGLTVCESLKAAELLEKDGIHARVINIHTIKPIDKDIILEASYETSKIFTVEEHSIIGGLGEAVASILGEFHPCYLKRIGINDVYGQSGSAEELLDFYKINAKGIYETIKNSL